MFDLEKELKELPQNSIALILVSTDAYAQTNIRILDIFVNKRKMPGIYITVNKPYKTIVPYLEQKGINTKKLFFIDLITSEISEATEKIDNCLFMESPKSLTDLSIALSEAVKSMPGDKFIFLDTLSTLLVYNQLTTVTKFAHFLTSKMRQWDINGLLVSMEKETDPNLQAQLAQFCDKVITL